MPHVTVANFTVSSTTDLIQGYWKLTRACLAAGWKYKTSGDTFAKDQGVTAGQLLGGDRWGIGGAVNTIQVGSQTGTSASVGAPSNGFSTISGLTGIVAASVGRFIQLSGYTNSGNNGIFRITAQTSTTATIYNPNAVAETGNISCVWSERYGGVSATIATAGTNGATPGRAKVTGLTNMRIPTGTDRGSVGNRLVITNGAVSANNNTWLITRVISTTEVEIENPSATSSGETNNGSLQWTEVDPLTQIYPQAILSGSTSGAWCNLQGPSTLKIPISNGVPVGSFFKGENIVQSTTGATGELLGVIVDTTNSAGYLVVAPRLNGTGGGVRGWATGNIITGSISGATVSQNGTAIEYVREMVIWKSNTIETGHIFVQCVDQAGESASRFSTLAAAAGVTGTLAPGGPTGTFPASGSWVMCGSGGSNSANTGAVKFTGLSSTTNLGAFHFLVANCIGTVGVSEDGSWTCAMGSSATGSSVGYLCTSWQICDNGEDGDVDPYVTIFLRGSTGYAGSRTATVQVPGIHGDHMYANLYSVSSTYFQGWRRRGLSSEGFQEFQMFLLGTFNSTSIVAKNTVNPFRVASMPNPRSTPVKEPIWICSSQTGSKMRKGTLRWWYIVPGGITGVLYNNGMYVGVGTAGASSSSNISPFIVGPWDGVTVASNG